MGTVRLYDDGTVIGLVEYTENLDHWDGCNLTCGGTGHHLGIGRLKDGRFYLCHGTQWQDEQDYAEVVTEDEAKAAVLELSPGLFEDFFGEPAPLLSE